VTTAPITKELFLSARTCPTLGWFLRNQPIHEPPSEGDQFRMEQGQQIGLLARSLFPGGSFIPRGSNEVKAMFTVAALANPQIAILFEATFLVGNYVVKPDILQRAEHGWRVIEVKSNLEGTGKLDELIDDLAYTVMVLKQVGVKIVSAELMLICREFRKGKPVSELFQRVDQSDAVNRRVADFDGQWDSLDEATSSNIRPTPKLNSACRSCPHFESDCLGHGIEHSVFSLPRLHPARLAELADAEIVDLMNPPSDFRLTTVQKRVVDCVRSGQSWVSPALSNALEQLEWPIAYLDFETVMTALPLYENLPPYAQVTTQYSIHRRQRPHADLEHVEYLADPMRDCEEELARRLIEDCGERGSIAVYSSFEKTRIRALAARFPELAERLLGLTERIFDLLRVIRSGYYHKGFGGSFSIKVALPVLVPGLRYDHLAIRDGDAAVARFAKAAMGLCSKAELAQIRTDLLAYCKQDTLGMVRLHEALVGMCGGPDEGKIRRV
jgi:hypothetical protein